MRAVRTFCTKSKISAKEVNFALRFTFHISRFTFYFETLQFFKNVQFYPHTLFLYKYRLVK